MLASAEPVESTATQVTPSGGSAVEARAVETASVPATSPTDLAAEAVRVEIPVSVPDAAAVSVPVVTSLASDLIGAPVEIKQPEPLAPDAPVATRAEMIEPQGAVPAKAIGKVLAGRLRDNVDIVIATLRTEAVKRAVGSGRASPTTPAAAPRNQSTPARPVGGLRASSEALAMLRNQLGVKGGRVATPAAPASRAPASSGGIETNATSRASAGEPRAPRQPLSATRKPAQSPADGARDRVMFVWHGRHFLAPMEGRHPLRVAQTLYDFMVEEAKESR